MPGHAPSSSIQRIVVKVGTNLLTSGTDHLDLETMAALVGQVARLHHRKLEVVLVTSGAVAAGRHALAHLKERKDTPFRQVLASVGQSRLMQAYEQLFGRHKVTVAQVLITRHDLADRSCYLNVRNTLAALLELAVVPIVNENDAVAVEELTGNVIGDNDNLSALVANLVDADLLLMLTDIGGFYTADPHQDPHARLIQRVEHIDETIEGLAGKAYNRFAVGGMVTKVHAAKLATSSGIPVVIASGRETEVMERVVAGEAVGTYFVPSTTRLESRKRWFLSGLSTKGKILVDPGAAQALREQHKSLLPAGVQGVEGDFQRGDIVSIVANGGQPIACGIANYNAEEIQRVKGLRSDKIQSVLGHHYGAEVVHCNNMVLL
jgi:glutamate 5-kinase